MKYSRTLSVSQSEKYLEFLSASHSKPFTRTMSPGPGPSMILWIHKNYASESCYLGKISAMDFSSVAQSCPTLCDRMNRSTPGLPVHHQLPEFTQTHVLWVGDAIQPSHLLSSPSPPALNLSQHQALFPWVSSSHEVAKILEFQLQHQSFQWTPRTGLLPGGQSWVFIHSENSQMRWLQNHLGIQMERKENFISFKLSGLPWWLSGKESACKCRRRGFDHRRGKIPRATEQLSPWASTIEPVLQSRGATATEPMS